MRYIRLVYKLWMCAQEKDIERKIVAQNPV